VDEAEDLEDAEEVEAVVQDLGVEGVAEDADHFEAEVGAGGVVEVAVGAEGVVEAEVDVDVAETGQPFKSIGMTAATRSRKVGMTI